MVLALGAEISMRKPERAVHSMQTIYFGGGTPSLLPVSELAYLIKTVRKCYRTENIAETTIEVNPDDVTPEKLKQWHGLGFDRLSVGIQSFDDADLQWMNRTHSGAQARYALECITSSEFRNTSIDLMYGLPGGSIDKLAGNLERLRTFNIPHFSAYALTTEERTAMSHWVRKGVLIPETDEDVIAQMDFILDYCIREGFDAYEISNFCRTGFRSRHNSAYWDGTPYMGFGPSAHSYDGKRRSWNASNNAQYLRAINAGQTAHTLEMLTETDRFNEFVMLNLRRTEGVDLVRLNKEFPAFSKEFLLDMHPLIGRGEASLVGQTLRLTRSGRHQADRICVELFRTNDSGLTTN